MPDGDDARWIVETINDEQGYRIALSAPDGIETVAGMHDLALFTNPIFERVLMLDGAIQVTTADEFIYHEMMTHVALFAHGAVRRILIVGGGDGGIAREALRHASVEEVTLVEIDRDVVDLARRTMPEVSNGAFDDPRLRLVIADGAAFVREGTAQYDAIIVDSPDPVGAGKVLFEPAFYAACKARLAPRGVLVTQSGMPFLTPDWFKAHMRDLASVFPDRATFLSTVPSYAGGPMAHGFCPLDASLIDVSQETLAARHAEAGMGLGYWTPALHHGAFALPGYIARML